MWLSGVYFNIMSTPKTDGGPAFPSTEVFSESLRDYFAAKAMHALLAHPDTKAGSGAKNESMLMSEIARLSYKQASAMIAEREKQCF